VFLHQLSYVIGKENLEKGMLEYYNTWKFKHPTPRDLKRIMEKVSELRIGLVF
jgi:aminopeptidase N